MSTTRVTIDPGNPATLPEGRFNPAVVDGTTEAEIAMQQQEDDAEAMQDMARHARRIRRRLGLSASTCRTRPSGTGSRASAARPAPHASCCGWLDKAPEAALHALS